MFHEKQYKKDAAKMLGAEKSVFVGKQATLAIFGSAEYQELISGGKKPVKLLKIQHPKTNADVAIGIFMN
jgi:hypothetical protein